jgi:hypothetical protein
MLGEEPKKMNLKDLIKQKLKELGADGLYCGWCECGCSIEELGLCNSVDLDECEPAKLGEDELFYPMETDK